MKFKYTRLLSAMMLGLGVTACGGGGGGDNPAPEKVTYSITSVVQNIDAEGLSSVTVCLDINGDAQCTDEDVEIKTTDSNGVTVLTLSEENMKSLNNMIAVLRDGTVYTSILTESVLTGGTKEGVKQGTIYINPISSQLTKYAKANSLSRGAAASRLANIIGVNANSFNASPVKNSPLDVIVRSLDANNDSLGNPSVVSVVTGAAGKVSDAMNSGMSSDAIVSSYKEYGDFEHLLVNPSNNAPVITKADKVLVSCRNYLFTAAATDADGDKLTYSWKFDNNESVAGSSVSFAFASNGTHKAVLTVTDGKDPVTTELSVDVNSEMCGEDLKALFTFTSEADSLVVTFSNVSTGNIVKYQWDFGDGSTSTAQNPVHQYAAAGTYNVSLTVTDSDGNVSETYTYPVEVTKSQIIDPAITSTVNGLSVTFSVSNVDNPVWVFHDGTRLEGNNVTKTYEAGGKYPVTLVYGNSSKTFEVEVKAPNQPVIKLGEPAVNGYNVSMSASVENAPSASTIKWDMGDGTVLTGANVTHKYAANGSYTITVQLLDKDSKVVATGTKDIQIQVNTPPVAEFTYAVNGVIVDFTNTASDADNDVMTYTWDFGDGSAASTEPSPRHTYPNKTASYTVKLTANDGKDSHTVSHTVDVVYNPPVNHKPIAVPAASVVGMVLTFDASQSSDEDGDTLSYSWDFGDNSSSKKVSGTHTYATAGEYTVTLTVSDGELSSTPVTVKVNADDEDVLDCTLK